MNYYTYRKPSAQEKSNIFLMSTAVSTPIIVETLREKILNSSENNKPRILVFEDGWNRYGKHSELSFHHKIDQRLNGIGERMWTRNWLKYLLGKNALIETIKSSKLDNITFNNELNRYDTAVLPGGNTFQLMRGLRRNSSVLKNSVENGSILYVGESAGSIVAGLSSWPATLSPADRRPGYARTDSALRLIDSEVIIHAEGHKLDHPIPMIGKVVNWALADSTTPTEEIYKFTNSFRNHGNNALILNDGQAADFTNGKLTIID
jgi:peptidase E